MISTPHQQFAHGATSMLTLDEQLARWAAEMPDQSAYETISTDGSSAIAWTWSALAAAVESQAAEFQARYASDAAIILSQWPTPLLPVGILAGLRGGVAVLPTAPTVPDGEIDRLARRLGATVVPPPTHRELDAASNRIARSAHRGMLLLQSSGTTGMPAVVRRPAATVDHVASSIATQLDMRLQDRVVSLVSLSHSYGVEHGVFGPIWAGATVRLVEGMDITALTRAVQQGATHLPGVPAMYEQLCRLSDPPRPDIRVAYSAGAPLPSSLYERIERVMGMRVAQLYGSTEVGSVTFTAASDPAFDPGAVGRPFPGVKITIIDPATGEPCPVGVEGDVIIKSPAMLESYADQPVRWHSHGFPTADLGHISADGLLTITGRARLLIDVGGAKVNPMEVEAVLTEHPAIAACVVGGMDQSPTVQRVKAWVELAVDQDAAAFDPSAVRAYLRQHLAGHKVPRVIEVVKALPRSATGKILRGSIVP